MLKNNLYNVISSTHNNGIIEAVLEIDKNSEIFKGHFPGQPVLPGACMLQIVKEILTMELNLKLKLKKASQMKFLEVIDPVNTPLVKLSITYKPDGEDGFNVTSKLLTGEITCFKFQGMYVKIA